MDTATAAPERPREAAAAPYPPFTIIAGDPRSGLVLLCDHAENRVPAEYGDLGLPAAEFQRHIAYDAPAHRSEPG